MFLNNLGKKCQVDAFAMLTSKSHVHFDLILTTNYEHVSSKLTCKDFDKCDQIGI